MPAHRKQAGPTSAARLPKHSCRPVALRPRLSSEFALIKNIGKIQLPSTL